VDLESNPETQEQSARMRSITQGRPPRGYSTKALEKSVIAALVSTDQRLLSIIREELNRCPQSSLLYLLLAIELWAMTD
jgi:hypothetical protein